MAIQDQFDHMIMTQGGHSAEDALLVPNVQAWRPAGAGGTNQGYLIKLDSGDEAYFKPRNGINRRVAAGFGQDASSAVLHEAIAWRLAREIGSPYDELVAPCVLRAIDAIDSAAPGALLALHGEALRTALVNHEDVFQRDPVGCGSSGFFDSLIAQQDRNTGNIRFDYGANSYRLIDHGYAFANHGDLVNLSPLLQGRACYGDVRLDAAEIGVLQRLIGSPDLLTTQDGLGSARAASLARRAESMLNPTVLPEGSF